MRGGSFADFFSTSRTARDKQFKTSVTLMLALLFYQFPSFFDASTRNGQESREHSFQLIYLWDGIFRIHRFDFSYIRAIYQKQLEQLIKQQKRSDIFLSNVPPKRVPADGNLAISDDNYLLQKHTIGMRKIPLEE